MNWTIISNENEHKRALERLEEIFDSNPQDSTFKEAELLSMLIEKYENEIEEPFSDPDPIEVLKSKLNQYDLKSKDLALILGGKSMASEILNKKRKLTLRMIRKINTSLGIPAEALLAEYDLVK